MFFLLNFVVGCVNFCGGVVEGDGGATKGGDGVEWWFCQIVSK